MSTIRTLTLLALIVVCSASLAVAGPGGGAGEGQGHPKPGRLGTPSEVICTLSGDMLTLEWGTVELAQQYRIYLKLKTVWNWSIRCQPPRHPTRTP